MYITIPNKAKNSLKYHQICSMDYLLIKVRPKKRIKTIEIYYILKFDFVMWAVKQTKSSMNLKDIREIGTLINDLEFLRGAKR